MKLTSEHIHYIIKDLHSRGIVAETIQEELIDHVCSAVEEKMDEGLRFMDAYKIVISSFGHTTGLHETQKNTITGRKTKIMLRNYLIIAWRNVRKQGFYSFINVMGLALGVAACLIIVLFVMDELSYDQYNSKADRIYRMEADVRFGGNQFQMAYRPAPEAAALTLDYPEIENTIRFRNNGSYLVRRADGTDNIREQNVVYADSSFFKIFSVEVLEGNPEKALSEPASIAISKRTADKHFPGVSAIGQSMILENKYHAKVTAVYANIPSASHFHFDIIISMVGDWPIAREAQSTTFLSENFQEYLLLKEGTDARQLESKLPGFIEKHMGPEIVTALGPDFTFEKFIASGNKYNLSLRPLTDIHLHSDVRGELEPNGSMTYVVLLSIVAAFILVIGCINFMNLSTARSSNRAKEVGVRKVMGSLRSHLVRQFLTESFLITAFAFVIALGMAYLFLPLFNSLAQKQLELPFQNPLFLMALIIFILIIGFLAGLYPSFFLSAFKPVSVLKGNVTLGMKSGLIRSSLVVFQFVISIFLMVGAISINRQLNFIQTKKLGFEKEQVVVIHDAYALRPNNVDPFKNEVLKLNGVESGSISGFVPVENDWSWRSNNSLWKYGSQPTVDNMVGSQTWTVDYDYVKTYQMHIKKGRDFSREFPSDSNAIILNETALKRLGLGDDPIGVRINSFNDGPPSPENVRPLVVIGVIEDFHFSSMKESISALSLQLGKSDGSVSFRFNPERTSEVVASIEKIWKQLAPGQPFQYSFLNEDFAKMYFAEQRLGTIFSLFAGLAIVIACLGLFALTAFTAEQRTKEIGIRKVLGASMNSIVILLSQEFARLIIIAFLLATPIAWYAINWWLQRYTYKVDIGWSIYALTGLVAFAIALGTMSYQSIKAASSDPVKSLKAE